ncbi:MAG: hypothetical protein ABI181_15325 [Mycobacteriaceae bacterium]
MAVPGGSRARSTLRELLDGGSPATWLREPYLPPGVSAGDDGAPLPEPPAAGYLADTTYAVDAATAAVLDRSPADALTTLTADELAAYRACSVDLTMCGGTTSGVVYPLAVCEIARAARVRNVGGASAGAIAAAATAAAELGRSRLAAGTAQVGNPAAGTDAGSDAATALGHVQPGYAGLAGILAWLAESDPRDDGSETGPEQHRLASLFQPAAATRALWPLVVALLQGRPWAAAPRALVAFGWGWALGVATVVVGGVAATATLLPAGGVLARVLTALAVLVGVALVGVGTAALAAGVRAAVVQGRAQSRLAQRPQVQRELLQVRSATPAKPRRRIAVLWAALAVLGVALVVLATVLGDAWALLAGVPVGVTTLVLAAGLLVLGAARVLGDAETLHYGLLSGATRAEGAPRPLVTWLEQTLRELAGQPGRTLTFGDLWFGDGPVDAAAATDARRRRVNLELITSDLTQQRSLSFPLPPHAELREQGAGVPHVRRDDLLELFGEELTAHLCPAETAVDAWARDAEGHWQPLTVHPLPEPADLPVIVAVRASLALPGLFTAVRTYRLRGPATVRDDLGAALSASTGTLTWPPDAPPGAIAEAVWLADGGITSNFPVQLFDALLPQWPTLGLTLGSYPDGFEHQDVWLPQDWQASQLPAVAVGSTWLGLLGSVLDTARSWSDRANTASPSTRGRVAWVRQRSGEGGTSLYMGRDVVASLGLRGALAGARLRQRYRLGSGTGELSAGWERDRWLRLRVAVQALEQQRTRTAPTAPSFVPLLDPQAARAAADAPAPGVPRPSYLPEDPLFYPAAVDLLARTGAPQAVPDADSRTPEPAPALVLRTDA